MRKVRSDLRKKIKAVHRIASRAGFVTTLAHTTEEPIQELHDTNLSCLVWIIAPQADCPLGPSDQVLAEIPLGSHFQGKADVWIRRAIYRSLSELRGRAARRSLAMRAGAISRPDEKYIAWYLRTIKALPHYKDEETQ
jgi:hypothetical protein